MRLVLLALKLAFWALPAQRVCTVAGLAVMAVAGLWLARGGLSPRVLVWGTNGALVASLPALVMGGPLWRAIVAQRAVTLAPLGRVRLLGAAAAIALLYGLAAGTYFQVLLLWMPGQWRWSATAWLIDVSDGFAFAGILAMASFLAARSLLATFSVLLVLAGGPQLLDWLELPPLREWMPGEGRSVVLLCVGLFAAWYLRVRRIAPPAWTSRRTENEAVVTAADTGGISAVLSRRMALQRLLLGGRSVGRILLQWLLALGLLEATLVIIRIAADVTPRQVAPLQFSALLLVLPAVSTLSWLVAARLRPLWLPSGCSRAGLFAEAERTLLTLAAALGTACAAVFLGLWQLVPVSPGTSLAFGLCALLGPLLLPIYAALLYGRGGAVTVSTMAAVLVPGYFSVQAYLKNLMDAGSADLWWWLAPLPVAILALRELARRRWLNADMPRAAAGGGLPARQALGE